MSQTSGMPIITTDMRMIEEVALEGVANRQGLSDEPDYELRLDLSSIQGCRTVSIMIKLPDDVLDNRVELLFEDELDFGDITNVAVSSQLINEIFGGHLPKAWQVEALYANMAVRCAKLLIKADEDDGEVGIRFILRIGGYQSMAWRVPSEVEHFLTLT